jgi:tetratricopeptide (TPR) repeat protein
MISPSFAERKNFISEAERYLEKGLYEKAITLAKERQDRFPGDVDAWLILASCWAYMGKLTKTSEILRELEEVIQGWSLIYKRLGDIYQERGLLEEAIQSYRKFLCLNSDPEKKKEVSEKIDSLGTGSNPDDLFQSDEGGNIDQISSDFQTITLAELYINQGHLTMARNVLKKVIKRDPLNVRVIEQLEYVESLIGKGTRNKRTIIIEKLNKWLVRLRRSEYLNV